MNAGYIIHLESAKEREPLVEALRAAAPTFLAGGGTLQVYRASDGRSWEKHPDIKKIHIRPREQVTRGMLGCVKSHLDILLSSFKWRWPRVAIFEDDCELLVPGSVVGAWIAAAPIDWDVLLLGANEYVESSAVIPSSHAGDGITGTSYYATGANAWHSAVDISGMPVGAYQEVNRFWGTHAMLVSRRAMHAALKVWAEAQKEGVFLPADWMWNETLRREGLRCYGPAAGPRTFFRQKEGLISAITGNVRGGGVSLNQ